MSVSRILAGAVALALGAAVVTGLAGATPEEKADRPAAAAKADQPETKASRLETKAERPETGSNAARSSHSFACPKEPWPYGCQWREPPTRRVTRGSRPAG
jgi:outer membrane murein-binding lipoprotein Lpp